MNYEMKLNKRYADAIRESDKEKFTFADFVKISSDCKLAVVSVEVVAEPGKEPHQNIMLCRNMRKYVYSMPMNANGDFNHKTQGAEVIPGIEKGSFQVIRRDFYNEYIYQFNVVGALVVVHKLKKELC